ncbi:hypothetical protein [Cyanobacterium sp. uoEpiScrs1]|uniref:hypothetical protein n=1 Tax=Cyanobacterium sp. uoEpiScrs1 TaxID=2976343 RepID=UPI00226AE36E|nr:hypothetical protein [Cyanobacterium sp. uoEpiScrs1]
MLVPLLSLILGIALLSITVLVYLGFPIPQSISWLLKLKNEPRFAGGISLVSLALILGIAGYLNYADASILRIMRICLGGLGLGFIGLSFLENIKDSKVFNQYNRSDKIINAATTFLKYFNVKILLTIVSSLILFSIFLISFFDANYGGDAFMYHIPFAARIWGIIPVEQYAFEYNTEHRFLGFPLLANFLQGFFWFIFQRPEATNLLCYVSLIGFIVYLIFYLKIPFYLGTIALLAVPMIHMHAARSYIDLPGNVAVSILILTTYLFYVNRININFKNLLVIFLSATLAANIKFQLIPVTFIILCFTLAKVLIQFWKNNTQRKHRIIGLTKPLLISFVAGLIIFATPIKNLVLYQNPFYPVKVEIAGVVLNHNEAAPDFMHENIKKLPPTFRWAKSVLEIDAFDSRRPWQWTLGMDFISWNEERFGMGGYFGGYVVFNILLFIYLSWKGNNIESKVATALMVVMTLLTSIMPQSYELRYYMYWIIVFVSLNCYLICHLAESHSPKIPWINPKNLALIAAGFMIIFVTKTRYFFTMPEFSSFYDQVQRTDIINQDLLKSFEDGEQICLVAKVPHSFLYNSYFHPYSNYSIKAEFDMSPEYIEEKCKGKRIVR